ncbi:MAG: outer membrane protein assembly factor BamD [Flavobacteriales bacterium]
MRVTLPILFILTLGLLSGCNEHKKVMESNDDDLKLKKAREYYNKGEYMKASDLLKDLVTLYRGSRKGKEVRYYHAYCHFGMEDYVMASYYFDRFRKTFPNSERAEEAFYMSAYCDYLNSPEWSLDQSETRKAIHKLQLFTDRYPNSSRVDSCTKLIEELRGKLERKAFEKSKLYLRTRHYRAAVESFENTLEKFPDSRYREDIFFLRFKARFKLALKSVAAKKEERLKAAISSYHKFAKAFPDSEKLVEAKGMLSRLRSRLEELEKKASAESS